MNDAGKGDRPRNNWGAKWSKGYDAIDWRNLAHKEPDDGQRFTPNPFTSNAKDAHNQHISGGASALLVALAIGMYILLLKVMAWVGPMSP